MSANICTVERDVTAEAPTVQVMRLAGYNSNQYSIEAPCPRTSQAGCTPTPRERDAGAQEPTSAEHFLALQARPSLAVVRDGVRHDGPTGMKSRRVGPSFQLKLVGLGDLRLTG